jgi:hypothetical protein
MHGNGLDEFDPLNPPSGVWWVILMVFAALLAALFLLTSCAADPTALDSPQMEGAIAAACPGVPRSEGCTK